MLNKLFFSSIALLLSIQSFASRIYYIDTFPNKATITVHNGDVLNLKSVLVDQFEYIRLVSGDKSLTLATDHLKLGSKSGYYALMLFKDKDYISNYKYENEEKDFAKMAVAPGELILLLTDKGALIAALHFGEKDEPQAYTGPTQPLISQSQTPSPKAEFATGQNIIADAKTLLYGTDETVKENILELYAAKKTDPFLSAINTDTRHNSGGALGKKILKADVTNLATGMARFLAERAKEELNDSFFLEMAKQMEKIPELQFYFPESYFVLHHYSSSKSLYVDLELLKEKFENDIQKLPRNIYLTAQDEANFEKMPSLMSLNHYLKNDPTGQWIDYGLQSVFVNDGHLNPKDLFYDFVHNNDLLLNFERKLDSTEESKRNLLNAIKLAELISNSLLSADPDRYWITREELNALFNDKELFKVYIGLVLAKSNTADYKINFNGKAFKELVEEKFTASQILLDQLAPLRNLIRSLHTAYFQVDQAVKQWEGNNSDQVIKSSYNLFNVFKDNIAIISSHIGIQRILGKGKDKGISFDTTVLYNYITPAIDIAYNIHIKKYGLAVKDLTLLLSRSKNSLTVEQLSKLDDATLKNTLESYLVKSFEDGMLEKSKPFNKLSNNGIIEIQTVAGKKTITVYKERIDFSALQEDRDFKHFIASQSDAFDNFLQKFERYGTLIANVASAENSDEVKAAIEASVLPVGSSRTKRHSNWSLTANSFVGAFGGQAFYKESSNGTTEKKSITTFGITAPIGISISKGFINGKNSPSSLGFMLQVFDLGALVNFYVKEGDGASLPENSKIQLGDIIAPGGLLAYSIGDTPFTLLAGVQYVPNLNRMDALSTNDTFRPVSWRVHAGIAIDIPLFNIKVWPK